MTKLRIASDIHLEHWGAGGVEKRYKWERIIKNIILPPLDSDKETTLILAGDISDLSCMDRFEYFMNHVAQRFKAIIYVQGNHEYYEGCWRQGQDVYKTSLEQWDNVFYDHKIVLKDITFLTTTLWTDFDGEDPVCMEAARTSMSDYKWIKYGERNLLPSDVLFEHKVAKKILLDNLAEAMGKTTTVVITHHAPSRRSILPQFESDIFNGCFANSFEQEILLTKPLLWIHGHMHDSLDYNIAGTRIICNPYGYHTSTVNKKYNNKLVVQV